MRHIKSTNSTVVSRLLPFLAIVAVFVAVSCSISSAQVLLTVDTSDISNVVITATGSLAGQNSSGKIAIFGVDLLGFFTGNEAGVSGNLLSGSSLQGGGSGVSYDDFEADNYSTGTGTYLDANLYVDSTDIGSGNNQNFTTASPAFIGTWTIDLGSLGVSAGSLPGNGLSGSIISGDSHDPGVVIGSYDVVQTVPEPTTMGLALVGFAITGMAIFRRKNY